MPTDSPSTPALCPIAQSCGGCSLIDLPYEQQLEQKRAAVSAALARFPELAGLVVEPTRAAAQPTAYRTRAKLACRRDGDRLHLGLYRPGTHQVTDVGMCPILHPRLAVLAEAVRTELGRAPFHALPLSYVSLRHSEHEARSHVTLVLSDEAGDLVVAAAAALMAAVDDLAGVGLNLNPGPPQRVFGSVSRHVDGDERLIEALAERELELSPQTFFQANVAQAAAIVDLAREELGRTTTTLLDFYAGAGVLGLSLAETGATVTLVEGYDRAADDARRSAERNGFDHVRVISSPAERVAATVSQELGRVDHVIVNPPRKGCAPAVLDAVARVTPKRVLYVSCDPSTLARDLARMRYLGLAPTRIVPVDMLPQTDHVEVVAVLAPVAVGASEAVALRVLHEDPDLLVVDKPPLVPCGDGGESAATVLGMLAAARGVDAGGYVVVPHVDHETSGALVVAKNPEVGRRLTKQIDAGTFAATYLALVRGFTHDKGTINRALTPGAATSRTKYRRLEVLNGHSLLAVTPEYGHVDQVRRHMAGFDHPIIGDTAHGNQATNRHFAEKYTVYRTLLHVAAVSFRHPRGGATITIGAPPPGDFATALARLGHDQPINLKRITRDLAKHAPTPQPSPVAAKPSSPARPAPTAWERASAASTSAATKTPTAPNAPSERKSPSPWDRPTGRKRPATAKRISTPARKPATDAKQRRNDKLRRDDTQRRDDKQRRDNEQSRETTTAPYYKWRDRRRSETDRDD